MIVIHRVGMVVLRGLKLAHGMISLIEAGEVFLDIILFMIYGWSSPNGDWMADGIYAENTTSAYVYYNLIYNIYGSALYRHGNDITSPSGDRWEIYNNTFITGSSAIQNMV